MNVLAIDTSTKACVLTVAKNINDPNEIQGFYDATEIVERTHSKVILPRISELLTETELENSQLDLIVFGRGPGSFTGLRIGIGVVQGLAFGLDIPVIGISSMACLAQGLFRTHGHKHSIVALTARKQEVYFGSYSVRDGHVQENGPEGVLEASEVPGQEQKRNWVGIGNGWQLATQLQQAMGINIGDVYPDLYPSGLDLVHMGMERFSRGLAISAQDARPEYLREQVAKLPQSKGLPEN